LKCETIKRDISECARQINRNKCT